MTGKRVCYHHGGASLTGIANPAFKHGRYSDYMAPLLAARQRAAVEDIERTKRLDQDIAFLHIAICDALERMHTGERGSCWDDLQAIVAHAAEQPGEAIETILPALQDIATKGKETAQAQREVIALIHDKTKVTSAEAKRAADSGEVVTYDQMKGHLATFISVFRDAVNAAPIDDETRQGILTATANDLGKVLKRAMTPAAPTQRTIEVKPIQATTTPEEATT